MASQSCKAPTSVAPQIRSGPKERKTVAIEHTTLPHTGVRVSRIGFGCAGLGNEYGGLADDDATAVVRHAIDRGITYFNTSTYYGRGLSEERLGKALAGRRARSCRPPRESASTPRLRRDNQRPTDDTSVCPRDTWTRHARRPMAGCSIG